MLHTHISFTYHRRYIILVTEKFVQHSASDTPYVGQYVPALKMSAFQYEIRNFHLVLYAVCYVFCIYVCILSYFASDIIGPY
jgi:hypothetical protein